jgi:hypothetical protein
MKNKFTDNQKIIHLDAWADAPLTMPSIFDICLKNTDTHIIVDCCKESELVSGFHHARNSTLGVNEDALMQKKTMLWNAEHNNRLSLIHGNYKLIPQDPINVYDIMCHTGDTGERIDNSAVNFTSGISSAITTGFFDDVEVWPTYFIVWHGAKIAITALKNTVKWKDTRNIDTMFMIKNRVPKPHRMLLLDELSKRDVLEDNMYSQYEQFPGEIASTMKEIGATHYHGKTRSIDATPLQDHEDWYATPPAAQDNALIEVVSETHIDRPFYTEKTVWPLVYMKPFMIMGSHLMNHNLTKYGFKLYDEFIDYSFDKIESPKERIIAMADELARLSNLKLSNKEYHELNEKLRPKIEHNLAVYLEMVFDDPYLPKIIRDLGNNEKLISQQADDRRALIHHMNGTWKTYTDRSGGNGVLMDIVRCNPYLQKLMGRVL